MPNRILEYGAWIERLVGILVDPLTKDKLTEYRVRVWCYGALDLIFNSKRQVGGGGDSWGIGDRWGEGNGGSKGNGRRERD